MSKNTRNRILLTALAALLLVTMAVGGTMAWLTATSDAVTNTFTTSEVIVDINENTTEYKMVPGATINKDPHVWLTEGSENAWIFVKVTEENNLDDYISYTPAAGWISCGNDVWVYNKIQGVTTEDKAIDFLANNQVTVLDTVTSAMMETAETSAPKLTFTPYALQSDNLSITVDSQTIKITEDNIETYAAQVWALYLRDAATN